MYTLTPIVYHRGFDTSYDYYRRTAIPSQNVRNNIYCSIPVEYHNLPYETVRREDALGTRLEEIRRAHLRAQQPHYDYGNYPLDWLYEIQSRSLVTSRSEALRLLAAEEEHITKLEELRQRRRQLEEEERLKTVVHPCWRKLMEDESQHLARKLQEITIAEQEEGLSCLIHAKRAVEVPTTAHYPYRCAVKSATCPLVRENLDQRISPVDAIEYPPNVVNALSMVDPPIAKATDGGTTSTETCSERQKYSATSRTIDFVDLLQQMGVLALYPPHPAERKETKQPDCKQTNVTTFDQPQGETVSRPVAAHVPEISSRLAPSRRSGVSLNPPVDSNHPQAFPSPLASTATSPESTLKVQLEKRLNGEYTREVRDTILAILNSIEDTGPAKHPGAGSSTSYSSSPSPHLSAGSDKGKAKEVSNPSLQSTSHSTKDHGATLVRLKEIESRFHALENEFSFPGKLDFVDPTTAVTLPSSTTASVTSHLKYTAINHPVRNYEQSLSELLSELDSISSLGNDKLRSKRRDIVKKVEQALEDLEARVKARRRVGLGEDCKRRSVMIEDVTSPDEHLMVPEFAPAQEVQPAEDASHLAEPPVVASSTKSSLVNAAEPSVEGSAHFEFRENVSGSLHMGVVQDNALLLDGPLSDASPLSPVDHTSESEGTMPFDATAVNTVLPLETLDVNQSTASEKHIDGAEDKPTFSTSGLPEIVPTPDEPRDGVLVDIHPDLATTIRPFTRFVPETEVSSIPITLDSESDLESSVDDSEEAEGILLENDVVEASHDLFDTGSSSSEWSEVDPDFSH